MDGKTLRHVQVELVSAVDGSGRRLATVPVRAGSNEIPAARELQANVAANHELALADGLHPQIETAVANFFRSLVFFVLAKTWLLN